MSDQRIQSTERMVGANHPTLADTLNRLTMIEHNSDGTHKSVMNTISASSYATLDAAITAIGSTVTTLVISSALPMVLDNTSPITLSIVVVNGGSITLPSGKVLTINGVFQAGPFLCFSGSGAITFGVGSTNRVYPEWWGAKVNDDSTDSGPAFRAALKTGVPVVKGQPGTYTIKSYDSTTEWPKDEMALFWINSNTTLEGSGEQQTFIKMATSVPPLVIAEQSGNRINFVGIVKGSTGAKIKNIGFDAGGFVVPAPPASAYVSMNMVTVGGDNAELDHLYAKNLPGVNYINIGYNSATWTTYNYAPLNTRITNSTLINGNNGVPGNTYATDCSFIYDNGQGTYIGYNSIGNDSNTPNTTGYWLGGIELHGDDSTVEYNTLDQGLYPAMYVGYGTATVGHNHTIANNQFSNSCAGIWFTSQVENVKILRNDFYDATAINSAIFATRNDTTGVSGYAKNNIIIEDNTFEQVVLTTNLIPIKLEWFTNTSVRKNTFSGYRAGLSVSGASDGASDNIVSEYNTMKNIPTGVYPGAMLLVGDDVSWSYTIQNVSSHNNTIAATSSTTGIYDVFGGYSGSESPTITNVKVSKNNYIGAVLIIGGDTQKFITVDSFTFTPAVSGSSTAGTGTYTTNYQNGYGNIVNNLVFFTVKLLWTAHTGSGNIQVTGFPFNVTQVYSNIPVSIWYSGLGGTAGQQLSGLFTNSAVTGANPAIPGVWLYQVAPNNGSASRVPLGSTGSLYVSGFYELPR